MDLFALFLPHILVKLLENGIKNASLVTQMLNFFTKLLVIGSQTIELSSSLVKAIFKNLKTIRLKFCIFFCKLYDRLSDYLVITLMLC